ncbi:hypothetical protein IEO21_10640 [Rhodonia placenta]|uniref:Uncharacterized protein n=1 Tax=Rhodonia placenta TaxID=104341 RepID=A0A8H7TXC4_9APHY|nr:hypothetical protein IEO21_10640 [Postia placenta]
MILKTVKNLARDPLMFLLVGGEDEYIIQEDLVHYCLEGRGGIGEAEKHHQGFVQSLVSYKGSLPLITGFDPDIVVSPSDVELREERSALKLIHHLGNQRQQIAIFDSDCI